MVRALLISTLSLPILILAIVGLIVLVRPLPTVQEQQPPVQKLSKKEIRLKIKAHTMKNFRDHNWAQVRHTLDSLFTVIDYLHDSLNTSNHLIDSLNKKITFYRNDYQNLAQQIDDLKKKLKDQKEQEKKIKELAKTLSGLKGKELSKIATKMNDL